MNQKFPGRVGLVEACLPDTIPFMVGDFAVGPIQGVAVTNKVLQQSENNTPQAAKQGLLYAGSESHVGLKRSTSCVPSMAVQPADLSEGRTKKPREADRQENKRRVEHTGGSQALSP